MSVETSDCIIKHDEFDFKRVCFKSPVKNKDKLYVCAASLDDGAGPGVFMQTPEMQVHSFVDNEKTKKSTIDLGVEDDGFYQLLRYLDTHIVQHVFRNREAWFHKDMNMADVEDSYRSPIQKGDSGPIVRLKLNYADGKNHTVLFENRKEKELRTLASRPHVVAVMQLRARHAQRIDRS